MTRQGMEKILPIEFHEVAHKYASGFLGNGQGLRHRDPERHDKNENAIYEYHLEQFVEMLCDPLANFMARVHENG